MDNGVTTSSVSLERPPPGLHCQVSHTIGGKEIIHLPVSSLGYTPVKRNVRSRRSLSALPFVIFRSSSIFDPVVDSFLLRNLHYCTSLRFIQAISVYSCQEFLLSFLKIFTSRWKRGAEQFADGKRKGPFLLSLLSILFPLPIPTRISSHRNISIMR